MILFIAIFVFEILSLEIFVSPNGECTIENDCTNIQKPCDILCPFENNNKLISSYITVFINLLEGVYDFSDRNVTEHYSLAYISVNNLNLTIQSYEKNEKDVILRGYPYPPSYHSPDILQLNGSIFYITGMYVRVKIEGFIIEDLYPSDYLLKLGIISSVSVFSSIQGIPISKFFLDSMKIRFTFVNKYYEGNILALPILRPFADIDNLCYKFRVWNVNSFVIRRTFMSNIFFVAVITNGNDLYCDVDVEQVYFFGNNFTKFNSLSLEIDSSIFVFNPHIKNPYFSIRLDFQIELEIIIKNSSLQSTGSIYVVRDCELYPSEGCESSAMVNISINGCDFNDTQGIYLSATNNLSLSLFNTSFTGGIGAIGIDRGFDDGSTIYGSKTIHHKILIERCKFSKNHAESIIEFVSFFRVDQLNVSLDIIDCVFKENNGMSLDTYQEGQGADSLFSFLQITSTKNSFLNIRFYRCDFVKNTGFKNLIFFAFPDNIGYRYTDLPTISIEECIFSHNKAIQSILRMQPGGPTAGNIDSDSGYIQAFNSNFTHNSAEDIFYYSQGHYYGGTASDFILNSVRLQGLMFTDNEATAIHLVGFDIGVASIEDRVDFQGDLGLYSLIFRGNNADLGGCIFAENVFFNVADIDCRNNKAKYGGGIFSNNAMICVAKKKSYLLKNFAMMNGGGVYQQDITNFLPMPVNFKCYPKYFQIDGNVAFYNRTKNDVSSTAASFQINRKENYCMDIGGLVAWSCYFVQIEIIDVRGEVYSSPTYEDHEITIIVTEPGERKTQLSILSSRMDSRGYSALFFKKGGRKIKNGESFPITIEFLGKKLSSKIVFHYESTFPTWVIILLICLALLGLFVGCFVCCVCTFIVSCCCCLFERYRKIGKENIKRREYELNFNKYSTKDLHNIYQERIGSGRIVPLEEGESVGILDFERVEEIRFTSHHSFSGNYNEEGTIFFHHQKRRFPVFRGSFREGREDGFGVKLRSNHMTWRPDKISRGGFWEKHKEFEGIFRSGQREGKGTTFSLNEHSGFNQRDLVGEWREGNLSTIVWTRTELPFIDIDQMQKIRQIYPLNLSAETASVLFESLFLDGRECVVKIFKDIRKIGMVRHILRARRLEENLKILTMFNHPNIIEIYAWSGFSMKTHISFGYVMEKCSNGNLSQYLINNERSIDMQTKIRILYQLATGIDHIHRVLGLIHRDLKSENVLVDRFGNVKICDFDFATRNEEYFEGKENEEAAAGSPFHIAPECLISEKFDSKCDVYSYGIMMYELIFGCVGNPYRMTDDGVLKCHVCGEEINIIIKEKRNEDSFGFGFLQLLHSVRGRDVNTRLLSFMTNHLEKCSLRPRFSDEENEGEEEEEEKRINLGNFIQLMKKCWEIDPSSRPSFDVILQVFKKEQFGREIKLVQSGRKSIN